jgi:hypothetical protein
MGRVKGKAYANRKPESERPSNDFYPTPSCMVKALIESDCFNELLDADILDPCCGKRAIGNILREHGFKNIVEKDIVYGDDFLADWTDNVYDFVIMNPPFKLFDKFVEKSKRIADRVYCIGKMNFFGAHNRNINGLWNNLEWALPFDRQIAFDKPEIDGKVECGMMVTGWFIWNKNYEGFPKIKVLDMQKYIRRSGKNERS